MAEEVKDLAAPGWKRDPTGRFAGRYWDGADWTEHVVSSDRTRSLDLMSGGSPTILRPPPSAPSAPAVTPPVVEGSAGEPSKGRGWPLWAKIALPVAVLVVIVAGLTSDDEPDVRSGSTGQPSTTAAPSRFYAIGETARTGDFDVTVHGFSDPQAPGPFLRPQPGMHFVSVDVQVANRTPAQQGFSSLLGFHLLAGRDRELNLTFNDITPGPPEGEIQAGQSMRGFVVFEVPDGAGNFRFRVQGSLTASDVQFTLR